RVLWLAILGLAELGVHIPFGRLIGQHHHGHWVFFAIELKPGPGSLAGPELLQTAPPAAYFDFSVRLDMPYFCTLFTVGEKRDRGVPQVDFLQGHEWLWQKPKKLGGAGDLLGLVTRVERGLLLFGIDRGLGVFGRPGEPLHLYAID